MNNSLSIIPNRKTEATQPTADLPPIDFVKVAEACGAEAYRCTKKEEVTPTQKKAFALAKPAVIEEWLIQCPLPNRQIRSMPDNGR